MATAQIQLYTIRVEPHSQTMTDQTRRHRVKHLARNETAGTGDPYAGLLVIRGASARQRPQHFALRLNFLAVPQIDIACDLGDEIPILIQRLEIFRATQCQRIFDRTLQMSMRTFNGAVFVRHASIVACRPHPVVLAQLAITLGQVLAIILADIAKRCRQAVGAAFTRHTA